MNPATAHFENAFHRSEKNFKNYRRITIFRMIVLTLILVSSCLAAGWGWGYNTRVAEQCHALDGTWAAHDQTCRGPEGSISLAPDD